MTGKVVAQHTEVTSGETQEELGLETNHSALSLQVSRKSTASKLQATPSASSAQSHHEPSSISSTQSNHVLDMPDDSVPPAKPKSDECIPRVKSRIQWPRSSKSAVWRQFDEDLDQILERTAKGDVDRRLKTMTSIIVSIVAERFGIEAAKPTPKACAQNRREVRIQRLREELKSPKRQYKVAGEVERAGLAELQAILRKELLTLRRVESHRRRRKERARRRAAFLANPYQLSKQLLGQKKGGRLTCSKDEINNHIKCTFSDPKKDQPLDSCKALINPPEPVLRFNLKEPSLCEVEEVVRRARAKSAPGPSGVPYKVYKNCPKLRQWLWRSLKVIWRRGRIAQAWRYAEGVFIPKEENSENIDQFWVISLLSVESKIFFSVVAKRLSNFLLGNRYIDTSVQKGGIFGVPGCLEHTGVVTQLIREAREGRGDLTVIWLDLTNAYGSIPHKLVEVALERYHVPQKVKELILDFYNKFSLRVSAGPLSSDWHQLEVGIITGCTISVTLFAIAMNMLIKSAVYK